MIRPDFKQFKVAQSANLYSELGIAKGDSDFLKEISKL
jgi:hypothetical protein